MPTENFNLPLIADNMANDVVRDMNALAEATDDALKGLGDGKANSTDLTMLDNKVTTHLDESNANAHQISNITNLQQTLDGKFTSVPISSVDLGLVNGFFGHIKFSVYKNGTRRLRINIANPSNIPANTLISNVFGGYRPSEDVLILLTAVTTKVHGATLRLSTADGNIYTASDLIGARSYTADFTYGGV